MRKAALSAELGRSLDAGEASFELGIGTAQGGFRVDLEVTGQVDRGKQQVADFIGDGCRVVIGHGFEHFVQLFAHVIHHRQRGRPVETDLAGALL